MNTHNLSYSVLKLPFSSNATPNLSTKLKLWSANMHCEAEAQEPSVTCGAVYRSLLLTNRLHPLLDVLVPLPVSWSWQKVLWQATCDRVTCVACHRTFTHFIFPTSITIIKSQKCDKTWMAGKMMVKMVR